MAQTIGCIGCGNMGGAILAGLAATGDDILLGYNRSAQRLLPLQEQGVKAVPTMQAVTAEADIIVIALKPYLVAAALQQIQPVLTENKILISVAAGVSVAALRTACGQRCPVVRTMPNTPALAGKGVYALCMEDAALTETHKATVRALFARIGLPLEMPESKFPAFSALIGAGPAYVFHYMNALVQAGVTLGFPRAEARQMVDALVEGCAAMAQKSTASHSDLRDQVCSPAGLTIAGVNHLERNALTGTVIDAVLAADKRGKEMEG
ncbi:MAG: pyrroline-5-carboxylate reductase [Desulfovibrionaceae bacterium]|nr:pyrroline-5-carboxylate reductase [Desulfovibrionaceae bacterium]